MDLIYTNAQREDQGVLMDYEMDLAFGQDENNFECTIASASHCCEAGSYLYMEGTEYGGIVDSIQSKSANKEVVYSGRTWHGILGSKVILPLQAGETAPSGVTIKTTDSSGNSIVGRYLIISGDAHDCMRFIISRIGLSDMFTAPTTLSRINIDKYQFNRYTDAYSGIVQMLSSAGQKLKLTYTGGTVVLSSVDKLDYSHDEEFNSELVEFDVKKSYKKINHLVCLGSGKLENRMIVNLYADKDGNISQTQTQFGADEYTSTFEYPNVESEEELISNGIEKMQALLNSDKISVDFDERMDDYDVGDTVGTFDAVTGLRIIATITKKIITIKNGQINIDISTDSNSSHSTGGESNTGRSDAVKSVNGMTGEVEITASDIGAVPTSRTVNGKALSSNINLSASDIGALASGGTAANSSKLEGNTLAQIMLKIYPVGAIYISTSSTSPASLFGGTWEQLKDRFLVGAGNSYSVNGTGGASSVSFTPSGSNTGTALTVNQIPSHSHGFMLKIQHTDGTVTSEESLKSGLQVNGRIRYYGGTYSVGGGQTHTHTFVGTKQTVSTMPPYLAVYMWKRVS